MKTKDLFESNSILQQKEKELALNELNKYKFLKKNGPFEYNCSGCGEKISYKLTIDLIEEKMHIHEDNTNKKPKQFILIFAKPFVNKSKYDDIDEYIYGIKKSFTLCKYKEKFDYTDFKDNSNKYNNLQDSNLIKVYNEMIKSVKEKNSRILINKFHLIFQYYISDFSNINNSIILSLDNLEEYNILDTYENVSQKENKTQNNIVNKEKNKEILSQNSSETQKKRNNKNNPNSRSQNRDDSRTRTNNKNNGDKSKKINKNNNKLVNSKTTQKNNEKISREKNNNAKTNQIQNEKNNQIRNNTVDNESKYSNSDKKNIRTYNSVNSPVKYNSNKKVEKRKEKKESVKKKETEKNKRVRKEKSKTENNVFNTDSKIPKENNPNKKKKSPSKEEKEKITKNFLYSEYNYTVDYDDNKDMEKKSEISEKNDKKENNKVENEEDEGSDWGLSAFEDDEELSDNKNENQIENKEIETNDKKEEKKEEKIFEEKNENVNNFDFDLLNINDIDIKNNNMNNNNNDNEFIGKKVNREHEFEYKKEENDFNNDIEREKKIYKVLNKKYVNNSQSIISISESDDDSNNFKNHSRNQSLINNTLQNNYLIKNEYLSRNDNENYSPYDNIFNSSSNNSIIKSSSNKNIPKDNSFLSSLPRNNKISNSKENPTNEKLLLKYLSNQSNIITNMKEILLIKNKIEKFNDLYFKLVYSSLQDKDDYSTFKNAVIDKYRHLILVKTNKNKKFAIYFNEKLFSSKGKPCQEIIDMMGFIFTFDRYEFFEPNERLICFTQSPPMPYLFKLSDYTIYIKNNFLSCKHHFGQTNKVFNIRNLYDELNGGDKEYCIEVLEVYRAEIPNK